MGHNDDMIFNDVCLYAECIQFIVYFSTSTHQKNPHQELSSQMQHKGLFASPKLQHRDDEDLHPALDSMFVAICKTISFNKKERNIF
jgi:hypothetical protein